MKMKEMSMSMLRLAGFCFVVVSLATSRSRTLAEEQVVADRTPLTFRDSGLYCNVVEFSHGPDPAKALSVTSLLSAQRAALPDTPWDFYIMQYPSESGPALVEEAASLIKEMVRNGKKIILRCVKR